VLLVRGGVRDVGDVVDLGRLALALTLEAVS
jgi:hypothetical protein